MSLSILLLIPSSYLLWLLWVTLRHPVPLSYNWRSLWQRWVGTLSTMGAIAVVVAIFVVVLSMAQGISKTFVGSGRKDQVLILRQNSRVEMNSFVLRDQARILMSHPFVARDEYGILGTTDIFVSKQIEVADGSGTMSVGVRGTTHTGIRMRQVRLVKGRWFQPGLSELVLPQRMLKRYANLEIGRKMAMAGRDWTIVGLFDGGGSAFDSEVWADADDIRQAYKRWGAFSSVMLRLRSPRDLEAFARWVDTDPRLKLEAKSEPSYFAEQTDSGKPLQILGHLITAILTVGAIFAAMNTMYASVAGRTSEIGTLRSIGFRQREILASFQWEAIFLTTLGGLLGATLSLGFNGIQTGTVNFQTWSDVSFAFTITPTLMMQGIGFSILMGILGGLPPALRAARMPLVEALKG